MENPHATASAPAVEGEPASAAPRAAGPTSVCVLGLGNIGLPTAALLASRGFDVTGVDVRAEVVASVRAGRSHIAEPDLAGLVGAAVASGRLRALEAPVPSDVFVIAVPTPLAADRRPDVSMVAAAARALAPHARPGCLVILESTCPVGTTEAIVARALEDAGVRPGTDAFVAYCPERVLPGRILAELSANDRVVGGIDAASTARAVAFYRSFVRGEVLATDARTAEMVKLAENSFRDVNIAFANELALLCEREGVNAWHAIALANRHPRVRILQPGPGVGGHCVAVDPWFLVDRAPDLACLIRTAREVNDRQPQRVVERVLACASRLERPVIACLGLAFKADVDDLRESPALEVVRALRDRRAGELLVVEPHLGQHPEFELTPLERALERADIVLLLVDHQRFRGVPRALLAGKTVIDTRGIYA